MAAELAAIEEQVWRASEGNPFVAVETVRALRHERGSRSERTLLPSRVHDLIAERLARLGEPSRQLVAVAAVGGAPVRFRAAAASGRSTRAGGGARDPTDRSTCRSVFDYRFKGRGV